MIEAQPSGKTPRIGFLSGGSGGALSSYRFLVLAAAGFRLTRADKVIKEAPG
jgi:hypothetical protein